MDEGKSNGDNKIGYSVGIFTDIPFAKELSVRPGLNFIQKGFKSGKGADKASLNLRSSAEYYVQF